MKHATMVTAMMLMASNVFAETNALHGVWTTGPVLSQLGMVITEREFRTNGTASTRVQFLSITNIPPIVMTSTYTIAGNKLITVVRGGSNETPYAIEGDTLILKENRKKETRLTRKKE